MRSKIFWKVDKTKISLHSCERLEGPLTFCFVTGRERKHTSTMEALSELQLVCYALQNRWHNIRLAKCIGRAVNEASIRLCFHSLKSR